MSPLLALCKDLGWTQQQRALRDFGLELCAAGWRLDGAGLAKAFAESVAALAFHLAGLC